MHTKLLLSLLFMLHLLTSVIGQNLSEHIWENRLILILADNETNTTYQAQLEELRSLPVAMKERKLLVYQITPNAYQKGMGNIEKWIIGDVLYKTYKATNSNFEIILIGLDGGIKLRETTLVTAEKLFVLIDSMPMRSNELRRQGQD